MQKMRIPKRPSSNDTFQQPGHVQMPKNSLQFIQSLKEDLSKLPHRDDAKLDALKRRAKMILTQIFGAASQYIKDLERIHFLPTMAWSGMEDSWYDRSWDSGVAKATNLLNTIQEEVEFKQAEETQQETSNPIAAPQTATTIESKQVFIVHGHDEEMKISVARVLEKLGLEPIILHEQADQGRTVIEKFVGHSDVPFAVVLFSPDDFAYQKNAKPESARPRARQNVVLELGFFLGKLGRNRVLPLFRQAPNFELPSDYAGVLFKPFDDHGAWRFELTKELNAAGIEVDANKLL